MTGETTVRKCAGCGFRFRALRGQEFCSQACAGYPATMDLLALLARFPARSVT